MSAPDAPDAPTPEPPRAPSAGRLIAVALVGLGLLVAVGVVVVGPWRSSGGGLLPGIPDIGPARIDVDTPGLRLAKQEAGIADCEPGQASNGLPRVTLTCFGGGPDVRLDQLAGPLVVNVWGSWCGPCRKELPYYEQLHQRLGDKVAVIGVDYNDPQTGSAMDLLTKSGVTYPQLADTQQSLQSARPRLSTRYMPVLALIDRDGKVAYANSIQIHSYDQLAGLVEQHLGLSA